VSDAVTGRAFVLRVKNLIDGLNQCGDLVKDREAQTSINLPAGRNFDDVFSCITKRDIRSIEPDLICIFLENLADAPSKGRSQKNVCIQNDAYVPSHLC